MSLFKIGYESSQRATTLSADSDNVKVEPASGIFGKVELLTKWIPVETLAIYAPVIAVLAGAQQDKEPNLAWTIIVLCLAPVFVAVSAWATGGIGRKTITAAILAAISFALWSLTIPLNGWLAIDWVADNYQTWVPIGAGILALLLAPVFEKIGSDSPPAI